MNDWSLLAIIRWLVRVLVIWLAFSLERAWGFPIFSLILVGSWTTQEHGWKSGAMLIISGLILAALYFWLLPLAMILLWLLYFWFKQGGAIVGSQTLRYLLGGWVAGLVVGWVSYGSIQTRQLVYLSIITFISILWLKRKKAWQLGSRYKIK